MSEPVTCPICGQTFADVDDHDIAQCERERGPVESDPRLAWIFRRIDSDQGGRS